MKYAFPDLPRRGLCNMLFTWAQAVSYCHHHNAEMIAPVWARIFRIGPWLRWERYKRYYGGAFTNEGYVSGIRRWWLLHFRRDCVKIFSGMEGFFNQFLADQQVVKEELYRIVVPHILKAVQSIVDEGPFIAVHIRRGDFANAGLVVPNDWYINAIGKAIEVVADCRMDIRVFTDGYPDEVAFVSKAFPSSKVIVMDKAPAIQDVLAMSRAKILVGTAESTFSMWAVFLGQMPSIWSSGRNVPNMYVQYDRSIFV